MSYQVYEKQMKDLESLASDMIESCFKPIDDSQVASMVMHNYANRLSLILTKINRVQSLMIDYKSKQRAVAV